MSYEVVEHTADLAIKVMADDMKILFEEGARAVVDITGARSDVGKETVNISVHGIDIDDTLVRWLQEIIYRINTDGFRLSNVKVYTLEDARVSGVIAGEYLFSRLDTEIKAATYHGLNIMKVGGLYIATITFDT